MSIMECDLQETQSPETSAPQEPEQHQRRSVGHFFRANNCTVNMPRVDHIRVGWIIFVRTSTNMLENGPRMKL